MIHRAVFAALLFFPYPALPVGKNTGAQPAQLAALACLPWLLSKRPGRHFAATFLLLAPVFVSVFVNAMGADRDSSDVLSKNLVSLVLAMVVLWPSGGLIRRDGLNSLFGIAAGSVLAHAAIGATQSYYFTFNEFPLLPLYINPTFRSMQEWAPDYALYIKRPCGLFPEPSAMAASLGPWVVLLTGLVVDGAESSRRRAWFYSSAATSGALLIVASRSGYVGSLGAALTVLALSQTGRVVGDFSFKTFVICASCVCAFGASAWHVAEEMGGNYNDRVESSWGLRAASMRLGLTCNTAPSALAFGVGPGRSPEVIHDNWDGPPIPEGQDPVVIWSLAISYYTETGFLGAASASAVMLMAVRSVARSSRVLLGACCLFAWSAGVTVTTSYMSLGTVWLFLGLLLGWERAFPKETDQQTSFASS